MTGTGAEAFVDLAKSFTKFQGPFVPVFFVAGGLAKLSGKFWWEFHGNGTPFLFLFFIIYMMIPGEKGQKCDASVLAGGFMTLGPAQNMSKKPFFEEK